MRGSNVWICRSIHWLSSTELYFVNSVLASWLGLVTCEFKCVCPQQHSLVFKKNKLCFLFWCWVPTRDVKCQRWVQKSLFHSSLLFQAMVKCWRLGYVQVVNDPNHPQMRRVLSCEGRQKGNSGKKLQQRSTNGVQLSWDLQFCILLCLVIFSRNENM